MRVSVFGIGYVGTVSTAGLIASGHDVVAVDTNGDKVKSVQAGNSPVLEPGVEELLGIGLSNGRLRAMQDTEEAVFLSDISLICVGTPQTDTRVELGYVFQVCEDIAKAIRKKQQPHLVVLRSTVPPGTWLKCRDLMTEIAGNELVWFAMNPEFLREGTALQDYLHPPYTIVGTVQPEAADMLRSLYEDIESPFHLVYPGVAEMLKYTANAWHATKVSFANEIGRISKRLGINGHEVMDLIVRDTKLNVSKAYMKPGFAFGGSCLPKDLNGLLQCAREINASVPLLESLHETNDLQVELAVQEIMRYPVRNVAVLGLAFKPGTDDLRSSPAVLLVKRLFGEGYHIRIYDSAVATAHLVGTNRNFIEQKLPHFKQLLATDLSSALDGAELIVLSHATEDVQNELVTSYARIPVFDLSGGLSNGSLIEQPDAVRNTPSEV